MDGEDEENKFQIAYFGNTDSQPLSMSDNKLRETDVSGRIKTIQSFVSGNNVVSSRLTGC